MIETTAWLSAAAMLIGLAFLAVVFQHRFIYFPARYSTAQLKEARRAFVQEIRFRTSRGDQAAFFWRNEHSDIAPKIVWLLFGGNGDLALSWMSLIREFPHSDSGYLLIDYPGYGICQGSPNPSAILENSERALQTLLEKKSWKLGGERLCVLGHSLGGAAALQFAAGNHVSKIILASTFTTMDDMVRTQIHIRLGPLLRHRFDNVVSLKTILSQDVIPEICIFHGEKDDIVPLKMGRSLAQLDMRRIKFLEIPGASHNDIFQTPLPQCLRSALIDPIPPV
jgi:pimeloyl-ACP methyl ester carboxylesterase